MRLSIIVAMDDNHLIGKDNGLPWHLPADLAFFKKVTTGHSIVMGRKTYDSIGRPLPNRRNLVITRNTDVNIDGCEVFNSIDSALSSAKDEDEVLVIGGANLCKQVLSQVERLYITHIEGVFEGDTYFPDYNEGDWQEISCESHTPDEKNPHHYHFKILERKS
ncbi:MAG TPA: type 3 dihydrofolate reductase [Candidatus Thioglobus sp.]|jgi:dihydrofolate reductase|nr:type 3 dihydrofolate reductase [Candidatus Thioglobus sp.]